MSTPISITAHAAVLTTGVERCYPIFPDQLHYFIYNVQDRDNSKYCNDDAKDKAPIWTKERVRMTEWLRKKEVGARGRIASEGTQMVGRKIIMVWESREKEHFIKGISRTKAHTEKDSTVPQFPQYSLGPDKVGEVVTGLWHCKHSSPLQLKEQIREVSMHEMKHKPFAAIQSNKQDKISLESRGLQCG